MLSNKQTLFKQMYKHNNKIIGSISFKNLFGEKIIKPNEQRLKDPDKIKEIVEYQDKYYKDGKKHFNFQGLINIQCCHEDGYNYLVDGQHRFFSAEQLYRQHKYTNEYIDIEVINVETKEELKENYITINKNTPLPEFPETIDKNIPETVASYFFNEYPDIWRKSNRPQRPFLNKNHFQEALGFLTEQLEKKMNIKADIEDIKSLIVEKNNKMSNWPIESYKKNIRKMKHLEKYIEKCKQNNFYLGMYPHISEEYCYEWVKDIIKDITGEELQKKKRIKKKKSIPKTVRDLTWEKYMGNQHETLCYCCRERKIKSTSFHCGHVQAESLGGNISTENLRPICGNCNGSMGTTNMLTFIKKHFPKNVDLFNNSIPPTIPVKSNTVKQNWIKKITGLG